MRQFIRDPESCVRAGNPVIPELIHEWENEPWSATEEYLRACVHHVMRSSGPVLECGSGLSTLLIAVAAQQRGRQHYALESSSEWADRVRRILARYALGSTTVYCAPLRDYGEFCWYDPPLGSMPDGFDLVVCDGPHGATKGGRYGLAPVMRDRLAGGAVILLDDADRDGEVAIADRWVRELDASQEIIRAFRPYIKVVLPESRHRDGPC